MDAKQTPLIDLLESVPADAVMVYEHDQFHSQNIPVGRLCHEAAAALKRALAEDARPQPTAWVGLTMEDKQEYVAQDYGGNRLDAMDWAEKRLKEKNT